MTIGEVPFEGFQPGDMAVDWDRRIIYTRSYDAGYWYDSRHPAVGMVRHPDEGMAASGLDFYRSLRGSGNLAPLAIPNSSRE